MQSKLKYAASLAQWAVKRRLLNCTRPKMSQDKQKTTNKEARVRTNTHLDGDEIGAALVGDGLGEQRLAAAGGTVEQHALRRWKNVEYRKDRPYRQ
jgi:hypothetical protein